MAEVLIKFISDVTELNTTIERLEQLGVIDKKTGDAFRETNAAAQAQQAALKGVGTEATNTGKSFGVVADNVQKATASIVGSKADQAVQRISVATGDAGINAQKLQKTFESVGASIGQRLNAVLSPAQINAARTQFEALFTKITSGSLTAEDAMKELQAVLVEVKKDISDSEASAFGNAIRRDLEAATGEVTSFRGRLQEIKDDINTLIIGGQEGSPLFKQLTQEAAELQDQVDDVNQAVRALASDTSGLDALLQGAQAVAGGFAVAQGIIALTGDENEELQKSILKVQGAMSILNGIQAIANTLQAQSSLMLKANAAFQSAYATTTGLLTGRIAAATVVQRAWNLAMSANPMLLLVAAAGLLAAAIAQIVSAETAAERAVRELSEALELQNLEIEQNISFLNRQLDVLQKSNDIYLKQLEANGATEAELNAARLQSNREQIQSIEELILQETRRGENLAKQLSNTTKGSTEEEIQKYVALQDAVEQSQQAVVDLQLRQQQLAAENQLSTQKFNAENASKQKEANDKRLQQERDLQEALRKVREEGNLASLPTDQRELAELDIKFKGLLDKENAFKAVTEEEEKAHRARLLGIQRQYTAERNRLLSDQGQRNTEAQYAAELASADKFFSDLADIEKQRFVNGEINEKTLNDNLNKITGDALEARINLHNNYTGEVKAADENLVADQKALLDKNVADTVKAEQQKIDAIVAANARRDAALQQLLNGAGDGSQFFAVRLLALNKYIDEKRAAIEADYANNLLTEEAYQEQLAQLQQDAANTRLRIAQDTLQTVGQLVSEAFNLESNQIQTEIDNLNRAYEVRKTNIEKAKLSERQKAKELARIEAEHQKELAVLHNKQAQNQKQQAIFQAIISGAAAALKGIEIFGPPPSPLGIAAIAAAGILTAAKIAIISKEQPPKFFKGTESVPLGNNKPGIDTVPALLTAKERVFKVEHNERIGKITNEEVVRIVELYKESQKHHYTPMQSGVFMLNAMGWRGTPRDTFNTVNNSVETIRPVFAPTPTPTYKFSLNASKVIQEAHKQSNTTVNVPEIDYEKLGKSVSKALAKDPRTKLSIDKDGVRIFNEQNRSKTEYLNDRYNQ